MNLEYTFQTENDDTWIDCKLRIDYSPGCRATYSDPGYGDSFNVENIDIVKCNVPDIPFISRYKGLDRLSIHDIDRMKNGLYELLEDDSDGSLGTLVNEHLEENNQLELDRYRNRPYE